MSNDKHSAVLAERVERVTKWLDGGCSTWGTPMQDIREILNALRQPTQSDAVQADIDAMKSILWVDTIIDDQEAIAKTFARHRQYGYDQGYYDGQRDRQPTQEQSK